MQAGAPTLPPAAEVVARERLPGRLQDPGTASSEGT